MRTYVQSWPGFVSKPIALTLSRRRARGHEAPLRGLIYLILRQSLVLFLPLSLGAAPTALAQQTVPLEATAAPPAAAVPANATPPTGAAPPAATAQPNPYVPQAAAPAPGVPAPAPPAQNPLNANPPLQQQLAPIVDGASLREPPQPRQPLAAEGEARSVVGAEAADSKLSKPLIEEKLQSIRDSQQVDEAAKTELLKRYKTALDWMVSGEDAGQKTAQYRGEIERAAELIAAAKAQLAAPAPEPELKFDAETTLQQMEARLVEAEARAKEAQNLLTRSEEELKRRGERKAELTKLSDETRQRLEEAKKQIAASAAKGESAALTAARRTEFEARIAALDKNSALYKVEARRLEALAELMPIQRDLAKRDKNMRDKEVASLQKLVATRRKTESERQAREARRQVAEAHPALRELAERNAALAEQHRKLAETITAISSEVTTTDKRVEDLQTDYDNLVKKVRHAGRSASIGLMLRKKRVELPSLRACEERVRFVAQKMPEANLERIDLEDEREALGDLDAAVSQAETALDAALPGTYRPYLKDTIRELLEKKRELLDKLTNDYDDVLAELTELLVSNRKLIAATNTFAAYIDENVLWIRSADTLGPKDFAKAVTAIPYFAQPGPWLELARRCGLDAFRRPLWIMAITLAAGVLIGMHSRLRTRMRKLCAPSNRGAALKFRPTLDGMLVAALLASPAPLLLAFSGWRMANARGTPELGLAVGLGLQYVALLLWLSEFTRQICKSAGLAEAIFNWSPHGLSVARRHLRWLTCLGSPLVFVVVAAREYQDGEWNNSLGRIAFMIAMLLLAAFMHMVLFSRDNALREILARKPDGWLANSRLLFYLAAIGLPCGLAGLAAIGFYYSAQHLAIRLEATLAMVLALVLMYALVSRWFLVKRRNLAIEQLRQRQRQESDGASSGSPATSTPQEQRDLSSIHEELHYLLRSAVVILVFVGGSMIWSDVLPALKILDSQELWWTKVEVADVHEDANGQLVRQRDEKDIPITLRHALIACLLLGGTYLVGRNLPALLEITVLDRLPFDRGARHAISVILRYAVAMGGVILACRTMHITWQSVQWLAAGMTVGLGFGLQEIFANFISGLILLFERPIRVGDIITLGETTGTVTNIRIRATTLTNWDRKELIVPNKELITGQLLNWTLSDTTNRIVINVGVAYKSDTRKARELILAVAENHPQVLEDPAPNVTFEAFGDSTLNFALRCYIATLDIRLATVHALHEAIHDRFNEEGIEIAFPQRDLHVRSIEQIVSIAPTKRERAA